MEKDILDSLLRIEESLEKVWQEEWKSVSTQNKTLLRLTALEERVRHLDWQVDTGMTDVWARLGKIIDALNIPGRQ